YAVAGIYGRRFRRRGVGPIDAAAGQLTASTILWTFAAAPSATACAALVALALLSTAVAYVLYFRILAVAGATNLLLETWLIPVAAILLGAGFLGEHLEPRHFAGNGPDRRRLGGHRWAPGGIAAPREITA